MKPAIYYALVPGWRPNSEVSYKIMAVTSEKPGRMIYGRDEEGCGTHRTWGDRKFVFKTEAAAKAALERANAVAASHELELSQARRAVTRLQNEQYQSIREALADAEEQRA